MDIVDPAAAARRLWLLLEPLHAVTYFAPEAKGAAEAVGLRGFWRGYMAQRAAPLGAVGPDAARALFFGFQAERVAQALPDVWAVAGPATCLAARRDGAGASLERLLADVPGGPHGATVAEAAELAGVAADAADTAGRALGAANQCLVRPTDPLLALWQAATTLREHRGDGHVAVLVTRGVDPVAAHRLKDAAGEIDAPTTQRARKVDDATWTAGAASLRARGWVDEEGRLTDAGQDAHATIEQDTDRLAAAPWAALGADGTARLASLLAPLTAAAATAIPFPNPMGVPHA